MLCTYETLLEAFRSSPYALYFAGIQDAVIESALEAAECQPESITVKQCPRLYQPWVVATAQLMLLDLVDTVEDDGTITIKPANLPPEKTLKKRTVLDITCEWEAVKTCQKCNSSRDKIDASIKRMYSQCVKSQRSLAGARVCPTVKTECRPCLVAEYIL